MRKKAKTWLSLCSLLTAIVCVGGGIQSLKANKSLADSNGVAATYVSSDTTSKGDWESVGFGKDGYMVFDGIGNNANIGFYSDMYDAASTGTTVAETTLMKISGGYASGWTAVGTGGWDISINGTTKTNTANTDTHTLKSNAIISSWGVNTQAFQGHGARPFKPYIPSLTTNTLLRMHGKVESGFCADSNIGFKLNTNQKVYVTLQIHDYASGGGNTVTTTDSVVAVYDTAYRGGQLSFQMAVGKQTIADCYGATPLASTDVTVNGTYVTFLLDGAIQKDYTFVVYREDTTATAINPSIGGIFFDYTQGLPVSATYVSSDTTTKGDWESTGYGQDGYMVFDGYRNGTGAGFYSDMYNVTSTGTTVSETTLMAVSGAYNTGWTAVGTGGWDLTKNADNTIAMNSTTKVTTTNNNAHSLKSDAIISSWGVNAVNFQGGGVRKAKPYIPGSTTNTQVRLVGKVDSGYYADSNIGFTLNTTEKVYVTLQVHEWTAGDTVTSTNCAVAVYSKAYQAASLASTNNKTVEEHYGTPMASTDITVNGTYVTFLCDGSISQNYTFVLYRKEATATAIAPSIGGIFFDYYEEEQPSASIDSASLTLDGTIGVNFYMNISDAYATDESAYVLLTDANGITTEAPIPTAEADGTYKFSVYAVAKDIAKTVKAQLFVGGEAVTEEYEYSVKAYCETVLGAAAGTYSNKLVALVTALLDYGNAADNYFNGASNEMIGEVASVTANDLADYAATQTNALPEGVTVTELSLVLESETSLKIYFTATSLDGVAITVDGVAVEAAATGRANEYCITIENIAVKELGNAYEIAIGECVIEVSALSYAYSALQYANASVGIANVVKALYLCNVAAIDYFPTV